MRPRPLPRQDATPPVTRDELLAALSRRRETLVQQDKELLTRQLRAEAANVAPIAPSEAPDVRAIAREILNGFAPRAVPASAGEALHGVIVQRRAIAAALEMLASEELQQRVAAVAAVMEARGEDWRAIVRRRAKALIELRRANRAADEFRSAVQQIAKRPASLICDRQGGAMFTASGLVGDATYCFLQDCRAQGIIDERDLDAN